MTIYTVVTVVVLYRHRTGVQELLHICSVIWHSNDINQLLNVIHVPYLYNCISMIL